MVFVNRFLFLVFNPEVKNNLTVYESDLRK